MKKTIRLTESDLIKIVQRVINEDTFTFGDKVRNKLGKLAGLPEINDDEKRLADDIMSKVESGDYNMLSDTFGSGSNGIYKIKVILHDEPYTLHIKNLESIDGVSIGDKGTKVQTPDNQTVYLPKGFTKKLINLIKKEDKGTRFRYPKNR